MSFWTLDVNQTEMSQDHCLTTSRGNMHGKIQGPMLCTKLGFLPFKFFAPWGNVY